MCLPAGQASAEPVLCQNSDSHDIPKRRPTALWDVANTDIKLLIYGLFQKSRVLAQDGVDDRICAKRVFDGPPAEVNATTIRTQGTARTVLERIYSGSHTIVITK